MVVYIVEETVKYAQTDKEYRAIYGVYATLELAQVAAEEVVKQVGGYYTATIVPQPVIGDHHIEE